MSAIAELLDSVQSGRTRATAHILSLGHQLYVERVAARPCPAQVVGDEPVGDEPDDGFVDDPVYERASAAIGDDSISVAVEISPIHPASAVVGDARQNAIDGGLGAHSPPSQSSVQ